MPGGNWLEGAVWEAGKWVEKPENIRAAMSTECVHTRSLL